MTRSPTVFEVNPTNLLILRVFCAGCKLTGDGTFRVRSSERGTGKRRLAIGPVLAILKFNPSANSTRLVFFAHDDQPSRSIGCRSVRGVARVFRAGSRRPSAHS